MHAKITTRLVRSLTPNEQKPYDVFDTEVTGFLLRVQPSGYRCYYLAYKTPEGQGKRFRIGQQTALSVAQARDLAFKHAAKVIGGEDVQATKQEEREQAVKAKELPTHFLYVHGECGIRTRDFRLARAFLSRFSVYHSEPLCTGNV